MSSKWVGPLFGPFDPRLARPEHLEQVRTLSLQLHHLPTPRRSLRRNGPLDRPGGPVSFGARTQGFACERWWREVAELGWGWGRTGAVMGGFALCISRTSGALGRSSRVWTHRVQVRLRGTRTAALTSPIRSTSWPSSSREAPRRLRERLAPQSTIAPPIRVAARRPFSSKNRQAAEEVSESLHLFVGQRVIGGGTGPRAL